MRQHEIEAGLKALGLKEGDVVLLHSALSSLGQVEGGADTVIDAFLNVLGSAGTLVVPTFGDLGIIPETVKRRSGALSSIHPRASVAAIGGRAEEICRDHWKARTAHGEDTPYLRIADLGGYVCLMGVDQDRNTMLHTVEELLCLPYLRTTEEHTFSTPEGEVSRAWDFFPGPHRNFIGLDRMLREKGIVKLGRIGPSVIRLMKARKMIDFLLEIGRKDPAFVLCDNPSCADCVRQRADLRRAKWTAEEFAVIASSGLAGRYVPEMLENCAASGVDAVELDYLQGYPVQGMAPDQVASAVEELRAGGCEVVSLRGNTVVEDPSPFLQTAADCGVGRVVLPLFPGAAVHARAAAEKGISISFCNTCLSSGKTFLLMQELRNHSLDAGLTFRPAGFAACGEKPFLTSFRNRLKRFVDQLDVEDCTFDGTPAALARGNAEIAELTSILRCSSFGGYMALGVGNRSLGGLPETAARFADLLDRI